MNNKLFWWCRSCLQEFNPLVSETPEMAHKRIWAGMMSGRCDKPKIERKPPLTTAGRVTPEKPPLLPEAGEPIVIK